MPTETNRPSLLDRLRDALDDVATAVEVLRSEVRRERQR